MTILKALLFPSEVHRGGCFWRDNINIHSSIDQHNAIGLCLKTTPQTPDLIKAQTAASSSCNQSSSNARRRSISSSERKGIAKLMQNKKSPSQAMLIRKEVIDPPI
jgi:hypothetical protein